MKNNTKFMKIMNFKTKHEFLFRIEKLIMKQYTAQITE